MENVQLRENIMEKKRKDADRIKKENKLKELLALFREQEGRMNLLLKDNSPLGTNSRRLDIHESGLLRINVGDLLEEILGLCSEININPGDVPEISKYFEDSNS